ncbi:MAG: PAS domain-containing protein [Candidatus Lokiarchaeota archaeon]|nr:PAS domain-containing protein [Candidatus Lokiarchaeota archaeon]
MLDSSNLKNQNIKSLENFIELFNGILTINNESEEVHFNFENEILNNLFRDLKDTNNDLEETLKIFFNDHYSKIKQEIFQKRNKEVIEFDIVIEKLKYLFNIYPCYQSNNTIILLFQDNTKKENYRISKEQRDIQNFIDMIPYSMELRDSEGYFIMANKVFKEMWKGHPKQSHSVLKDHHTEEDKKAYRTVVKGGLIRNFESLYNPHPADPDAINKDYWVNADMFPLFDKNGKVESVALMYQDITERKEAELEIEYLKRKLEKRIRERTIKLENSERKYRIAFKRANCFKGIFDHEISNIINQIDLSMKQVKSLLVNKQNNHQILQKFVYIEEHLNRGKKIINNIRNLSEIEKAEIPLISINLQNHLKKAIEFVKIYYREKYLTINVNTPEKDVHILANELLMEVFENILIGIIDSIFQDVISINIILSNNIIDEIEYVNIMISEKFRDYSEENLEILYNNENVSVDLNQPLELGLSLVAKYMDLCEGKFAIECDGKKNSPKCLRFILFFKKIES